MKLMDNKDIFYSFLPMAHVMEQGTFTRCCVDGVRIGYTCGDPLKLMEDI